MSQTLTRLGAAVGFAAVLAAPQAQAGIGDSLVASGGNIVIRFEGSDASFNSLISVNGSTPVFPNHSTAVGPTLDLGFFAPGTPLDIVLQVLTTGNSFHSGPGAGNPDGLAHANVIYNFGEPGRTFVGFEDILGGGDKDYNDYIFSFKSVTAVPEPETNVLMLAGLIAVAWLSRRRNSTRF